MSEHKTTFGPVCTVHDCIWEGRWIPEVQFWPLREMVDQPSRIQFSQFVVCDRHRRTIILEDLLSEQWWQIWEMQARVTGAPEPDRDSAALEWVRYEPSRTA